MEKPTKRTPLALPDLANAVLLAWPPDLDPTRAQVELVLAHIHGETGLSACYCWNLGNVKYFGGPGDYCRYRCSEVVTAESAHEQTAQFPRDCRIKWEQNGKAELICEPAHPWSRFLAFDSLEAGVAHYLRTMRSKKAWWAGVLTGDPVEFSKLLKSKGYYTAPLATYTKLVVGRLAKVRAALADWPGWGDVL